MHEAENTAEQPATHRRRRSPGHAYLSPEESERIRRQVDREVRDLLGFHPADVLAERRQSGARPKYPPHKTYLVVAEGTHFVKIGRAKDPQARLRILQTGQPFPLSLAWVSEGNYEADLHRDLAAHRVRGEWFDLTPLGDPVEVVTAAVERIKAARGW